VTWLNDNPSAEYEPDEEPEGKRWVGNVVGAIVLAIIGSGSAFAWHANGGTAYSIFAPGVPAGAEPKVVGLDEFRAFQQQVIGQMQSNAQALAAQQAEVKRLSDQVAAVSAKIDAIQSSMLSARAAVPAAAPIPLKKPSPPKPAPHAATGAAPAPPPIQLTH
jgi:uncharacterized coiled-coil protein SlyX